jgi:3-deoxy-7-phosphoheptulonate synthase
MPSLNAPRRRPEGAGLAGATAAPGRDARRSADASLRLTQDVRIREVRPLISPAILLEDIPSTPGAARLVTESRAAIAEVVRGRSSRLLVVVGPCSIHDPDAALEYGERLERVAARLGNGLLIVMRVYLEKPRTAVGWKGFVNDPDLDQSCHINKGLRLARKLLLDLNDLGMPTASEFLDTQIPQHIGDLTSWAAIGARTTESQVHRELASGLSMPVGFKNSTAGNVQIAVDAVVAARSQHWFPGVTFQGVSAIFHTAGNDSCHVILRGGAQSGPNYDRVHVDAVCAQLLAAGLPDLVMVDCSHANSGRDHRKQPAVLASVCDQIAGGSHRIMGVMLESHLKGGRQEYRLGGASVYGQSITDACLSLEETEPLLERLSEAQARRGPRAATDVADV